MITYILSHLLHAANRNKFRESETHMNAFYAIKDKVLAKYGKPIGYDVQHIDGKTCHSCGGRGRHPKFSNRPPYNIYDWADCYHCWGGWFRFPKWICLRRIQFGKFVFHKPLKREERVENPFTEEAMGWNVTENPVIEGYIEHDPHWLGSFAMYFLFLLYNQSMAKQYRRQKLYWRTMFWKYRMRETFTWPFRIKITMPEVKITHEASDEDLPF